MTLEEAIHQYGPIEHGVWADETKHCSIFVVPEEISATWINSGTGLKCVHIYANNDLHAPLALALHNVIDRGLVGELKTFDGCLMQRDVRGLPGVVSTHSYAMSIDINAAENKLGEKPTMSPELVDCFGSAGFHWGGLFKRNDGMHFQYLLDW